MLRVLQLYGGQSEVLRRMNNLVKNALEKFTVSEVVYLSEALNLPMETLDGVVSGSVSLDWRTFDLLSPALHISVAEVLGSPAFPSETEKAYWEGEYHKSSLSILMAGEPSERLGGPSPRESGDPVPLETYLRWRAIQEIIKDNRK